MLFLEPNLDGLIVLIILIMVGPALLLGIIGGVLWSKQNKKAAKVFFILAALYLVISFGICGSLMM